MLKPVLPREHLTADTGPLEGVKLCYLASEYMSHWRVAQEYSNLIGNRYRVVADAKEADIVVLHIEPCCYDHIYTKLNFLKEKYVVGYCVWEASELPDVYKHSISYLQEIWTCSRYCFNLFSKYHPVVTYIPHVIERNLSCSNADRALIRRVISYKSDCVYYLVLTKMSDKRKNAEQLIKAFNRLTFKIPKARLVIKALPTDDLRLPLSSNAVFLGQHMADAELNALYELADIYVSLHHAEGWGLTLSDAMLFRKPVIATGYSGNLEFMNPSNSFLVDFTETSIQPQDSFNLFTSKMKWAYPKEEDVSRQLLLVYGELHSECVTQKVENAAEDIKCFSRPVIRRLLHERLSEIAQHQR